MPSSFPGGFLCLETAGDDAGNELLLCGPCLSLGRAGSITWKCDLGFTLPIASQEDMPLLDAGLILPSEIVFQLQLQTALSCWQRLG